MKDVSTNVPGMDRSQRRNGSIYRQHPRSKPPNPVLMIVGFGHLRHGMGIPSVLHIFALKPSRSIFLDGNVKNPHLLRVICLNLKSMEELSDRILTISGLLRQEMEDPCRAFRNKQTG